jgi:hypothetical protein
MSAPLAFGCTFGCVLWYCGVENVKACFEKFLCPILGGRKEVRLGVYYQRRSVGSPSFIVYYFFVVVSSLVVGWFWWCWCLPTINWFVGLYGIVLVIG